LFISPDLDGYRASLTLRDPENDMFTVRSLNPFSSRASLSF